MNTHACLYPNCVKEGDATIRLGPYAPRSYTTYVCTPHASELLIARSPLTTLIMWAAGCTTWNEDEGLSFVRAGTK